MLLIVLLAILTIVFGWISYALFDAFENQIVSIVALVLAVASGVCAVIFGTMALAYRIGYKADKISAETRYQGIIHQIETVKYTDDIAKERLYEQIIAWNQDVERGKPFLETSGLAGAFHPSTMICSALNIRIGKANNTTPLNRETHTRRNICKQRNTLRQNRRKTSAS